MRRGNAERFRGRLSAVAARALLLLLAAPLLAVGNSGGPPPAHTGGFGERNCTACHSSFPVNPAGGSVSITRPLNYLPGSSYAILVSIQDTAPGRLRWGFELSARFIRDGKQAGYFTSNAAANVGLQAAGGVQYAGHSPSVRQAGAGYQYTVLWTAPPDAVGGDIIFHAAANAANSDQIPFEDRIFTTQAISAAPIPPKIAAGGVVNAASFVPAPNNAVAPGSLISIFGENLAAADAAATKLPLPTELNGTRLVINGQAAPLVFVSPKQINAQLPFETGASAPASVVAFFGALVSAAETARVEPVAPGIFTVSRNGAGPAAVLHSDSVTPVTAASPAKPGETVVIFCTGLGRTEPPALESGKAGAGQRTQEIPSVTIGGKNARVDFSGAAPGFAGLYQVNAVVPDLATGEHALVVTAAGKQSQPGATVRVGQ